MFRRRNSPRPLVAGCTNGTVITITVWRAMREWSLFCLFSVYCSTLEGTRELVVGLPARAQENDGHWSDCRFFSNLQVGPISLVMFVSAICKLLLH